MRKVLFALLMAAALTLTACGGGDKKPAAPAEGGGASVSQNTDVKAAVAVDFTTMDPQDTNDTLSGGIQRMVMEVCSALTTR